VGSYRRLLEPLVNFSWWFAKVGPAKYSIKQDRSGRRGGVCCCYVPAANIQLVLYVDYGEQCSHARADEDCKLLKDRHDES
jgi:hypothetical protein